MIRFQTPVTEFALEMGIAVLFNYEKYANTNDFSTKRIGI